MSTSNELRWTRGCGGGQRGGACGVVITNFWSIVLDDHWSKKIYRPKMIAWWLVLYSFQMILFYVDIAVIWDICWSRHYWGNWSEEKARRLEGLGRKTSPFFLTVLFCRLVATRKDENVIVHSNQIFFNLDNDDPFSPFDCTITS